MATSSRKVSVRMGKVQRPRKPVKFSLERFQVIAVETVDGALIKDACRTAGIDYFSFATWLCDPELEEEYGLNQIMERARRARAWLHMDECIRIADNRPDPDSDIPEDKEPQSDTLTMSKGDYSWQVPNREWIMRSKLRVDTRMAVCKVMAPDIFGGKSAQAINNATTNVTISAEDAQVVGYEHGTDRP